MSMLAAWLAAGAAALATLVLYLLRPPARRLVVHSVLIWERVLRGSRRPADRLRWWLSLILAMAIATLIALSVSGRQAGGAATGAGRTVVALDNSPTMAARTTQGGTRLDLAKAEGRRLIKALPPGALVMVADTQRQIATPAFETPADALLLLERLKPGHDPRARIPDVAADARASTRFAVSDGVLLRDLPADTVPVSVFEPVENVGITAFDLATVPGDPRRYQAFLELSNAGGADKPVVLEVTGSGASRISRELVLPANGSITQAVDVSGFDGGPIRAALVAPGDALALDDVAYGFLPMRRVIRVTLVTPGSAYLVKSLSAQPRARVRVIAPSGYADRGDADLYVFDRFAPPAPPRAPAILFNPGRASWLPSTTSAVVEPEVSDWEGMHPVLQNISLRDLYIEAASPARPAADGDNTVLVGARSGGALVLAHDSARRWVWLAFDLSNSNFGLHAAFPAFLNNAIRWLAAENVVVRAQPGAVRIALADARVVAMDGTDVPVTAIGAQARFNADRPGIYTAVNADNRIRIAVNLLDRAVTEVNRSSLEAVSAGAAERAHESWSLLDWWTMLLLAAAALLLFEWITYNRRVTV
jgi:hypothetical protein